MIGPTRKDAPAGHLHRRGTLQSIMLHRKILSAAAALFVAAAIPSSRPLARQSDENLNVAELVRDAYRNGAEMSGRIYQYTWTDTRRYRAVGKGGKVKEYPEQVYEVFPNRVSGHFLLRRLVKENGVPVSPERAAKELKRLAEEIEKDEREAEERRRKLASKKARPAQPDGACVPQGYVTAYGANGGLIAFGISDFICACEFSNPRRGKVNGRDAVMLDFRPRADYVPPGKDREPITKLRGRVWIDAADRVVSRLEAWPASEVEGRGDARGQDAAPEPVLVYEQVRLPDGTWMHAMTRINTTKHGAIFNKVTIEFQEVFTDYKRFGTEESYRLDKPKQ